MRDRFLLLLPLICFHAGAAIAQEAAPASPALRGVVFLDEDADGKRDSAEPGVAAVRVSNGRDIAVTDAQGRYSIALRDGDTLFVIKPAGHALPRRADGMPDFWKHHFPQGSPALRFGGIAPTTVANADFALLRAEPDRDAALDVLVFGDPQPKRLAHVAFYDQDIVQPLQQAPGAALGLSLGDIVDDDLSLYVAMKQATAKMAIPWLHLPGNHDLDLDARSDAESLLSYRQSFGPDTYAWEEAEAVFVLLDDVIFQPGTPGMPGSVLGGLRDDQFRFLESYLGSLSTARRVVVAAHIPFFDTAPRPESFSAADRRRLFELLRRFPRVLLLSSHSHTQRHVFHGPQDGWHGSDLLHEYNVGAACGGFWSGLEDDRGIPDARMSDGTPNGYARMRVTMDDYRLRWFNARDPADVRIALHAPRVLRAGSYPAFGVSANVFMGMDETRVEYRIDGREWMPMARMLRADPALLALNADDDRADALRSVDRAVEAVASNHLWRGALPTDLGVGEHRIEVRAFDRWDGELRAQPLTYRLDDPARP